MLLAASVAAWTPPARLMRASPLNATRLLSSTVSLHSGQNPWFADGLRFSCSACGNCCSGSPGYIYFTAEEANNMARQLGMSTNEFYRSKVRRVKPEGAGPEGPYLYTLEETPAPDGNGQDCILLDRSSGKGLCSVYTARPSQCKSWPFWAGNVESADAWQEAKAGTPCPGMGSGPLVSATEVTRIAIEDEQNEHRLVMEAIAGTSEVEAAWLHAHSEGA
eukprot:scaffold204405_cov37-Tisochrysis_lutea.AAC.2